MLVLRWIRILQLERNYSGHVVQIYILNITLQKNCFFLFPGSTLYAWIILINAEILKKGLRDIYYLYLWKSGKYFSICTLYLYHQSKVWNKLISICHIKVMCSPSITFPQKHETWNRCPDSLFWIRASHFYRPCQLRKFQHRFCVGSSCI